MAVESNVYGLWVGKQPAKGTPALSASATALRQVGGDIAAARDEGEENYSDNSRFGDIVSFVNSIQGSGTPVCQATPDTVALLSYLFYGQEVFTVKVPGTSPPKYEFEPGASGSFYTTWWKKVGLNEVVRQQFNDTKLTGWRIEGSTANKVVKINPTLMSLDPAVVYASDPVDEVDRVTPFMYTEGSGNFEINGVVFRCQSQFAIAVADAVTPYFGDSIQPCDMIAGQSTITIEGLTVLLNSASLSLYNEIVYGTPSPVAGTRPTSEISEDGSYTIMLERDGATADERVSVQVELPGVKWAPDVAVPPNPDGGAIELTLAGTVRKRTGQPSIKVTVETGAGSNTPHT